MDALLERVGEVFALLGVEDQVEHRERGPEGGGEVLAGRDVGVDLGLDRGAVDVPFPHLFVRASRAGRSGWSTSRS